MFITFILEQHHNLYYSNTNKKPAKIFHDIIIVSLDIIMIIRGISHYGTIVVSLTNIPLLWSYVSLAPPLLLPLVIKQWKILQKWRFIAWNKSIYIYKHLKGDYPAKHVWWHRRQFMMYFFQKKHIFFQVFLVKSHMALRRSHIVPTVSLSHVCLYSFHIFPTESHFFLGFPNHFPNLFLYFSICSQHFPKWRTPSFFRSNHQAGYDYCS